MGDYSLSERLLTDFLVDVTQFKLTVDPAGEHDE